VQGGELSEWECEWERTSTPVSIAFPKEGYFLINAAISGVMSMVTLDLWVRRGGSVVKGECEKFAISQTRNYNK
jgi:hypothetical protein